MIERKWDPELHKLEEAFFPVELCDLKVVYPAEVDLFGNVTQHKDILAKGHKAVVDVEKRHVFSTVTDKYQLVTNKQAYEWAEPVIEAVFNRSRLKDFDCFNVRMTSTRSSCWIDLIRKLPDGNEIRFEKFDEGDPWTAFIRITNSYNKTFCLKYQLGFCRWICQNGMIFNSRSVSYVFAHTQNIISEEKLLFKLSEEAKSRIGEIHKLEDEFIAKLNKLKDRKIPEESMLALVCKIFGQTLKPEKAMNFTDSQKDRACVFTKRIKFITREYCEQFGPNAYAAMNILTDYASYPEGMNVCSDIPRLQTKAGAWVDEFVKASEESDFKLSTYLGDDAIESAKCFESLQAAS